MSLFADILRSKTWTASDLAALIESIGSASFPMNWQSWTPTLTGFSVNPTIVVATYIQFGKLVLVNYEQNAGTSNATGLTISAPVTAATRANAIWGTRLRTVYDNGAYSTGPGVATIASGASTIGLYFNQNGSTLWTNSGAKQGCFSGLIYEAA